MSHYPVFKEILDLCSTSFTTYSTFFFSFIVKILTGRSVRWDISTSLKAVRPPQSVRVKVVSAWRSSQSGLASFPPLLLLHSLFSRRDEAEGEEAAAARRAAHSGSSFPSQRRAVVFVQGPSLRQLARHSGRTRRHPADTG